MEENKNINSQNPTETQSLPKSDTIPINTKSAKDDIEFQKFMLANYSKLSRHIRKDLNSSQQLQYIFHKNFNKDDVTNWVANPEKYEKQLRNLSRFLYDSSSHYKRLIQYFSTMLTFDYIVMPYGLKANKITEKLKQNIQDKYVNVANYLETMNLKHEFLKVCEKAWVDDAVYLYEYRLDDSYFLETLNPDYCQINGIEDGCYVFSFNFKYFDSYPKELDRFAPEFKEKYLIYKANKKDFKWQEIDSANSMCLKINENIDYCIPPFAGVFEELYDIEDYKLLKKAKTELDNYLLLTASIPYRDDKTAENAFALSLDIANQYFDMMSEALPDQVGAILSPFKDVEAIKIDKNDKNADRVMEAESALYNSAGVSQLLFNSQGATGSAMTKSIVADEAVSFKVLRQFERWTNKKLKDFNKGIKFKVKFLDITKYSSDSYIQNLKDGASLGLPVKLQYCAALGMSPVEVITMTILENDVMDITNTWKPLVSSFQTNANDGSDGRPKGNEDDLSEGGQTAIDNDSNKKENRD